MRKLESKDFWYGVVLVEDNFEGKFKDYSRDLRIDKDGKKYILLNKERVEITGLENEEEYQLLLKGY